MAVGWQNEGKDVFINKTTTSTSVEDGRTWVEGKDVRIISDTGWEVPPKSSILHIQLSPLSHIYSRYLPS